MDITGQQVHLTTVLVMNIYMETWRMYLIRQKKLIIIQNPASDFI